MNLWNSLSHRAVGAESLIIFKIEINRFLGTKGLRDLGIVQEGEFEVQVSHNLVEWWSRLKRPNR